MNLYLDDDCAGKFLVKLLGSAGHDVQIPADVGLGGEDDAVHLSHAVRQNRVLVSRNHKHFKNLHDLVLAVQGHHPGILAIRLDNDPKRDLKDSKVVRAIANLVAAGVPIADEYIILNHWR